MRSPSPAAPINSPAEDGSLQQQHQLFVVERILTKRILENIHGVRKEELWVEWQPEDEGEGITRSWESMERLEVNLFIYLFF